MIRLVAPFCALVLAGCAGSLPNTPVSASSAGISERGSAAGMLARAGQRDAPGPDAIIAALGAPDVDRREGAGAMLSWRLPNCALALGFAADARGALRLAMVLADAPRPGLAKPTPDACAAEAQARSARP